MVHMNPFCDSDHRYSLQLLAGINLLMSTISFIVDLLVIAEVAHYYTYWNREEMKLSPSTVDLVIVIDIVIIALQVFYGLQLYNAICDGAYTKIRKWRFPSAILLGMRILVIIFYIISMPVSPFHWYYTIIVIVYSVFLFWPVNKFLKNYVSIPIGLSENSRLLQCVN